LGHGYKYNNFEKFVVETCICILNLER